MRLIGQKAVLPDWDGRGPFPQQRAQVRSLSDGHRGATVQHDDSTGHAAVRYLKREVGPRRREAPQLSKWTGNVFAKATHEHPGIGWPAGMDCFRSG